jgi:hypothetical protein
MRERRLVGIQPLGRLRRAQRVGEAALEIAAVGEVIGQILDPRPGLALGHSGLALGRPWLALGRSAPRFERLADLEMQAAAADRVELLVEDLADLVVGEAEVLAALGAHELGAVRLVEGVEHLLLIEAGSRGCGGDRRELAEREGPPQGGRGVEHGGAGLAEAVEAPPDGLLDALRDGELRDIEALPFVALPIDLPLLDQDDDPPMKSRLPSVSRYMAAAKSADTRSCSKRVARRADVSSSDRRPSAIRVASRSRFQSTRAAARGWARSSSVSR